MILDTNALSAFADGEPGALAEIDRAALIAIPVIVLGEFLFGIVGANADDSDDSA